jgi:hypothetical protein
VSKANRTRERQAALKLYRDLLPESRGELFGALTKFQPIAEDCRCLNPEPEPRRNLGLFGAGGGF